MSCIDAGTMKTEEKPEIPRELQAEGYTGQINIYLKETGMAILVDAKLEEIVNFMENDGVDKFIERLVQVTAKGIFTRLKEKEAN